MDFKSYLAILRGNLWVILITAVVTTIAVTIFSFLLTPIYTASTTLRIATASSGTISYSDYMYADRLMNTYIKLATSGPVMDELLQTLNLNITPEVKVAAIPNTELIKITVESPDPATAQLSADTLAEIMIIKGKELYSGEGKSTQEILAEQLSQAEQELNQARQSLNDYIAQHPTDTEQITAMNDGIVLKEKTYATLLEQYDAARLREMMRANLISIVEPADFPYYPSKPNKVMNISLGVVLGFLGGLGLAITIEYFGNRLYTSKQIESAINIYPIGKIPSIPRSRLTRQRGDGTNPHTPFKEAFRRLQVHMFIVNPNNPDGTPPKTILITSSEPGEGKSTITTNLAIACAQSGKKVIVVDCDLHRPKQHKILGLPNGIGLSSVLTQQTKLEKAIQTTLYPGFSILTTGPLPPNPAKLLASANFKSLILWLSQQFDVVLLDTPAFLAVSDTSLLTPIVDGVLFVARRNYIREEAIQEACGQLSDLNARILGLVINDAEKRGNSYYYKER